MAAKCCGKNPDRSTCIRFGFIVIIRRRMNMSNEKITDVKILNYLKMNGYNPEKCYIGTHFQIGGVVCDGDNNVIATLNEINSLPEKPFKSKGLPATEKLEGGQPHDVIGC
ncbi:MAG: hypothetical protein V1648_03445 [Candidatus Aenigmatarchaeota archaeon]